MNFVEPIRDKAKLHMIEDWLYRFGEKYYVMFEIGIYSGLRVSDILPLRKEDVWHKTHIKIREKKTGKYKMFVINPELSSVLDPYAKGLKPGDLLIPSNPKFPKEKPVSTSMAYKVLRGMPSAGAWDAQHEEDLRVSLLPAVQGCGGADAIVQSFQPEHYTEIHRYRAGRAGQAHERLLFKRVRLSILRRP